MQSSRLKIINAKGLHARAASKLVDVTRAYASDITIEISDKQVDAKSIMALLMLGAPVGTELHLNVAGADEHAAHNAVVDLINAGFHELDDE